MTDLAGASPSPSHRSRWFVLGYGAAQMGAFICFIPLLTLLLPEKAAAIAGPGKVVLLSFAATLGGLTAAAANFLFGALSDRTRGRLGRRRPWIIAGLVAVAISLALVALARTPVQLVLGLIVFQIAVNALFAPLTALVPDLVPDTQKGLVSAWGGAALPVANLFTAVVVSRLSATGVQFGAVVLAAAVLIAPFAIRLREPAQSPGRTPLRLSFVALRDRGFRALFASRLLAESAVAINTLYLLFWLQGLADDAVPKGWSALDMFGLLLVLSTLAAAFGGFAGGALSDRLRGRRGFVIAGSAGMALGLGLMVGWPAWQGLLAAQLLFGLSHGVHSTTVAAMTAESLPDLARSGRDLGVMNMAIAGPQSLAPAGAALILISGLELSAVFAAGALAAFLAALVLIPRGDDAAGLGR